MFAGCWAFAEFWVPESSRTHLQMRAELVHVHVYTTDCLKCAHHSASFFAFAFLPPFLGCLAMSSAVASRTALSMAATSSAVYERSLPMSG